MRRQSDVRRTTSSVIVMIAVVGSSLLAEAQSPSPPRALAQAGSSPLVLLGHAKRVHLAGIEDLYGIALYATTPFDHAAMVSGKVAKALRIEITYERDWHRPPAVGWHRELVPRLEPAAAGHLHRVFAPLQTGDIVLIEYSPRKGTTIHVNRSIAVSGARHELMLAFLDHWLGQRPVSEDVKRALLGHS